MKRILLHQKITLRQAPRFLQFILRRRPGRKPRVLKKLRALIAGITLKPKMILEISGCAVAAIVVAFTVAFAVRGDEKVEPLVSTTLPALADGAADEGVSNPTGSGLPIINREQEITHIVQSGQTFSEIAYIYKVSVEKLAAYNHVADVNKLAEGTAIKIPTLSVEKNLAVSPPVTPKKAAAVAKVQRTHRRTGTLKIVSEQQFDGTAVTAHFTATYPEDLVLTRFEWSLGDGRKSFRPDTFWTYENPGTYTVSLKATDKNGADYIAENLFVDVPHPTTTPTRDNSQHFLTLESMDKTITVNGSVIQFIHFDGKTDPPMEIVSSTGDSSVFRPTRPGYFGYDVNEGGTIRRVYVFASPIDSTHSDRSDLNWYRTQFNTGTQSNCGPTVASMAIAWATGSYVAVSAIRQELGWTGNGGTNFTDIMEETTKHGVPSALIRVSSQQDIFDIIDRGNIAIILYNSGGPNYVKGRPGEDLFGRYYYDSVGHYIIVKGYSKDKKYFVVYDPIPSDWGSNSFRYADGISMIGRNRYYGSRDLFSSLSRYDVIEIFR
jgi:LysM repeat protein